MISRDLTSFLATKLHKGKVIVLIGPRQVGKTTMINTLLADNNYLFLDGDDHLWQKLLVMQIQKH
jgi:hypothetical protein